jgi:hypothetical protein
VFFYRFLDYKNESVEKFGKKSKLTKIFEYTVKTTLASQNFKKQIFSKKKSTILLDKNNKNSIEELFTKNSKMAEKSKMADIGSPFFKKLP